MAGATTASLTVSFSEREGRIVLVQATKRLDFYGRLIVHCYSSIPVEYISTVGSAYAGANRSRYIWGEGIKFSDSRTATLKYPNPADVVIDLTRSIFMHRTTRFGRTIFERVYPTITYDSDKDILVADQAVYGACSVSYYAPYQIVYYVPQFTTTTTGAAGVYGGVFRLGSLFAYNEQAVETLDMEMELSSTPDYVEYARVVSKIVLDPKGVWEFPRNWQSTYNTNRERVGDERQDYPPDGTFDGYPDDTVDGGNCFVDERVHLIVEVSSSGYLRYFDFNNGGDGYWGWENPYFGNSNYDPIYEIRFAEPPGGSKASSAEDFRHAQFFGSWREVFLSVDKQELITKIQTEYPGASAYSRPRQ